MKGPKPNWFSVTQNAWARWERAMRTYEDEVILARRRNSKRAEARAQEQLEHQRRDYRNFILGWYRKLLLPIEIGQEVPKEVSWLLAEEWDDATREQKR